MSREIRPPGMGYKNVSARITYELFKKIRKSAILLDCSIGELMNEFVTQNMSNWIGKKLLKKKHLEQKSVPPQT